MIVWLASFPRSGNTFLRIILNSVFGLSTSTLYPHLAVGINEAHDQMNELIGDVEPAGTLAQLETDAEIHFLKTHELVPAGDQSPAVYVVRDGRDALVSYAHFVRTYEPDQYSELSFHQSLEMLIRSWDQFGGWSRHVMAWSDRTAPTAIVRYEDLLIAPVESVVASFGKLGVPLPTASGAVPDFHDLRAQIPAFFRRGQTGAWKTEMTKGLQELFWSIHGMAMERFGYGRDGLD